MGEIDDTRRLVNVRLPRVLTAHNPLCQFEVDQKGLSVVITYNVAFPDVVVMPPEIVNGRED